MHDLLCCSVVCEKGSLRGLVMAVGATKFLKHSAACLENPANNCTTLCNW